MGTVVTFAPTYFLTDTNFALQLTANFDSSWNHLYKCKPLLASYPGVKHCPTVDVYATVRLYVNDCMGVANRILFHRNYRLLITILCTRLFNRVHRCTQFNGEPSVHSSAVSLQYYTPCHHAVNEYVTRYIQPLPLNYCWHRFVVEIVI